MRAIVPDKIVGLQKAESWRRVKVDLRMILSAQSVRESSAAQYGEMEKSIESFISTFESKLFLE